MIIIDTTGVAIGRVATFAAKKLLTGEHVVIVNCEEAVITGKPNAVIATYHQKLVRGGTAQKGPYYSKTAERIARRTVRGMLPWKRARGRAAYKLIKCFTGIPKEYEGKEMLKFKHAKYPYVKLGTLVTLI